MLFRNAHRCSKFSIPTGPWLTCLPISEGPAYGPPITLTIASVGTVPPVVATEYATGQSPNVVASFDVPGAGLPVAAKAAQLPLICAARSVSDDEAFSAATSLKT